MIPTTRSVPVALRIPGAASALVLHREEGAEISESLEGKAWNSFNREQSLSFDSCQRKCTLTFECLLLERKTWLDSSQISTQYCFLGKGTQSQSPHALWLLHLLHDLCVPVSHFNCLFTWLDLYYRLFMDKDWVLFIIISPVPCLMPNRSKKVYVKEDGSIQETSLRSVDSKLKVTSSPSVN